MRTQLIHCVLVAALIATAVGLLVSGLAQLCSEPFRVLPPMGP